MTLPRVGEDGCSKGHSTANKTFSGFPILIEAWRSIWATCAHVAAVASLKLRHLDVERRVLHQDARGSHYSTLSL